MKIYTFGAENALAILLLPGTCCHWKGNFEKVIPLLACRPEQWAILVKSIMEGKQ